MFNKRYYHLSYLLTPLIFFYYHCAN